MLLFLDESGTDHKECPYEVLGGIAIQPRDLWTLIQSIRAAERDAFGIFLSEIGVEFKGSMLLNRGVFAYAAQSHPMLPEQRRRLCTDFLKKGFEEEKGADRQPRIRDEFTAYGQACLEFVNQVLVLCSQYRAKVFASIVNPAAVLSAEPHMLRRDYALLFRRFAHYVQETGKDSIGIVVFDERDQKQSRRLFEQMENYFLKTNEGRSLSACVLPEPLFVHSDLTMAVRIADVVSYIINWGFRLPHMSGKQREEMKPYANLIYSLSYKGQVEAMDGSFKPLYGIIYLDDFLGNYDRSDSDRIVSSTNRQSAFLDGSGID